MSVQQHTDVAMSISDLLTFFVFLFVVVVVAFLMPWPCMSYLMFGMCYGLKMKCPLLANVLTNCFPAGCTILGGCEIEMSTSW